ncbi:MAG: AMP-binding protein [Gammaproteobacteria bacterium]
MQAIWFQSYPENVEFEIDLKLFNNLVEMLELSIQKYPRKTAFHCFKHDLNYQNWGDYSKAFAYYLKDHLGLKKGDRLGIMLPNVLAFPIVFLGALKAGLTLVNINPQYTMDELAKIQKDAQLSVLVYWSELHSQIVNQNLGIPHLIASLPGDFLPWYKKIIVHHLMKKQGLFSPPPSSATLLSKACDQGKKYQKSAQNPFPILEHNDIALLQYTGGTTGTPKGAMLSHSNLMANVLQSHAWIKPLMQEGQEIIVTALPLFHVFSLMANFLLSSYLGAKNILITNPKDILGFVNIIKNFKFTAITGVSTLFAMLVRNKTFKALDFSNLKLTIAGGMALQSIVAKQWLEITGKPILEGYGLTEASPIVCINPVDIRAYNGYIGLPIPSTQISIRDPDGHELGLDNRGELWVKGPQVMQGYWENPEESSLVLTQDGWLKTGDVAVVNAQGFVKIVDRIKDLIIVGGFNVYPNEIEEVISKCAGVKEVGVVGIGDIGRGEYIKAVVVKEDPNLSSEQIIDYCKQHLVQYKIPKVIEFRESLPKSNVGKILRRELKENAK